MNIGAVPHHAFPSIGYAMNAANAGRMSGRMSIPVAPGLVIYSHFKHVSGTPAPEGTQGVNINKLKILDTLIEQLSNMKKQPSMDFSISGEADEKRINVLIEQYQKQLKAAQAVSFYPPAAPAAGLLFNITA